jgi:hypothetical protein
VVAAITAAESYPAAGELNEAPLPAFTVAALVRAWFIGDDPARVSLTSEQAGELRSWCVARAEWLTRQEAEDLPAGTVERLREAAEQLAHQ